MVQGLMHTLKDLLPSETPCMLFSMPMLRGHDPGSVASLCGPFGGHPPPRHPWRYYGYKDSGEDILGQPELGLACPHRQNRFVLGKYRMASRVVSNADEAIVKRVKGTKPVSWKGNRSIREISCGSGKQRTVASWRHPFRR